MAPAARSKEIRHKALQEKLNEQPYLTDGELAERFGVSVPTIRLDRLALGIPELRESDEFSYAKSEAVSDEAADGFVEFTI